jgi:hypothetical protein
MDAVPENHAQKVVKFVQELLLEESDRSRIGPVLISEQIDMVLGMRPAWGEGLDHAAVTEELIRRFSMWIGRDGTLKDEAGHVAWLDAPRKRHWRLWRRYSEWLERDLSPDAINALDQSTDGILGLLEDPERAGDWDRRGLVVGHVQSGKTGSYTGLICKAADAGYKIIIVLAGLHNNLRSQTQMRLDEGFLGYATAPSPGDTTTIGVGEIDADPSIRPNYVTNRTNGGDFSTRIANSLGISPEQRPWLFVVKKNKTVLTRLLSWVRNHAADSRDQETGRRLVTKLPLLVIDDEADHASVDTGEQVFDEQGRPDEEHSPTAINQLIRRLLHSFTRSAYVGYTATPFANIFIHERGRTREEGPDLFPNSFIINLAAPSTYVGAARIFGLRGTMGREGGLPMVHVVLDHQDATSATGWMPQGHKSHHRPVSAGVYEIPSSLREAILSFLLACTVRRLRGQGHRHSSMLIHVTRFNAVQAVVHQQVADVMRGITQRLRRGIDSAALLTELRRLWDEDFVPTTATLSTRGDDPSIHRVEWNAVAAVLPEVAADIEVRMINGTAKDALDYVENAGRGLKVIAIGGDKLARGLTLEGLCTSYFLRASRMYDTLMQMGRWFGYRPGYLDLCRLYTTSDLVEWFGHVADASEELREEFDMMQASGGTPRDYGLKVQSHPVLMVTSRLKMRSARSLMLSFSGQVVETVVFHRDPTILASNLQTLRAFVERMGAPARVNPVQPRPGGKHSWEGALWSDVPAESVIDFLGAYRTHPDAYRTDARLLAEFIASMAKSGELSSWTVAVLGGGERRTISLGEGVVVKMPERKQRTYTIGRFSIGRLLAPRDEAIDLSAEEWAAALALTQESWRADPAREQSKEPDAPSGTAIRRVRGFGATGIRPRPESGLMLLYVLDPLKTEANLAESVEGVVSLGLSFPGSRSGMKVEYKVNNVLWEQEFGSSE